MKAFAVAVILLAVMLTGTVGNYWYINTLGDRLEAALEEIPAIDEAGCTDRIEAFLAMWEDHSATVGLSVAFPTVDRLSEQAQTLLACAQVGDAFGFAVARELLRDAIDDMRRLETFSIANLL